MNNEEELILNEVIKKHNKLKKSIKKFNDCNFDYEDKMYIVCDYITDLVEENEKNVDTIHELVNIIQIRLHNTSFQIYYKLYNF